VGNLLYGIDLGIDFLAVFDELSNISKLSYRKSCHDFIKRQKRNLKSIVRLFIFD